MVRAEDDLVICRVWLVLQLDCNFNSHGVVTWYGIRDIAGYVEKGHRDDYDGVTPAQMVASRHKLHLLWYMLDISNVIKNMQCTFEFVAFTLWSCAPLVRIVRRMNMSTVNRQMPQTWDSCKSLFCLELIPSFTVGRLPKIVFSIKLYYKNVRIYNLGLYGSSIQ